MDIANDENEWNVEYDRQVFKQLELHRIEMSVSLE